MNLNEIAEVIKNDIDFHCSEFYDSGFREHLGASIIGDECKRYLWMTFRWVYRKKHDGRQQRLFNRGQLEEVRFNEWLKGIGFTVYEVDPETGKQFRISDCNGHFGGSLDGVGVFPQHYKLNIPVVLEYKTHGAGKDGKGKAFDKLQEKGLEAEKYVHFAQTSVYGYKNGIEYGLYLSINKNNDDLHVELVKLDFALAKQMIAKADQIINTAFAPARISDNPNFYKCRMCDMRAVCHERAATEKNCRSCKYSQPIENGQWGCGLCNQIIPNDFIVKGCDNWESIL